MKPKHKHKFVASKTKKERGSHTAKVRASNRRERAACNQYMRTVEAFNADNVNVSADQMHYSIAHGGNYND